MDPEKRLPISAYIFVTCGLWLVGLGAFFAVLRPPLLAEDVRYIGNSLPEIQAALPGLARWLSRVFIVLGGFVTAAGALTVFVVVTVVRGRTRGIGPFSCWRAC